MAAQESIKGYLYQTLIALLQMLEDEHWDTVAIEPKELDEKVDIYWEGVYKKAIQVKSSKSRINKIAASEFITQLKDGFPNADAYELVICAHVTSNIKNGQLLDNAKLRIKTASPIDLTQQAAQRLDSFLHGHGISQTPPLVRELLTRALVSQLIEFSTNGDSISRTDFEEQIKSWVLACYPEAARNARFSMCEVANGPCEMHLTRLKDGNTDTPTDWEELVFICDLYFVNASLEPSIIQFVVFSLTVDRVRHFFLPRYFFDPSQVDNTSIPIDITSNPKAFEICQPICVVPKGVERRKLIAFSLRSEITRNFLKQHKNSEIVIEVFVKYHHVESYFLAHSFDPNILFDELFEKKKSIAYRFLDIEQDQEAVCQPIRRVN